MPNIASKVMSIVQPTTKEELEAKRKLFWDRIDTTVYNRRTGDTLMPFQREGVEWLGLHPRGILADEMVSHFCNTCIGPREDNLDNIFFGVPERV